MQGAGGRVAKGGAQSLARKPFQGVWLARGPGRLGCSRLNCLQKPLSLERSCLVMVEVCLWRYCQHLRRSSDVHLPASQHPTSFWTHFHGPPKFSLHPPALSIKGRLVRRMTPWLPTWVTLPRHATPSLLGSANHHVPSKMESLFKIASDKLTACVSV